MGIYSEPCPDSHYMTCRVCGVVWHLAHMDLADERPMDWLCQHCRPPEPHCETCACYVAAEAS